MIVTSRVRGSHEPQQSKQGFHQEGKEQGHQAHILNTGLQGKKYSRVPTGRAVGGACTGED